MKNFLDEFPEEFLNKFLGEHLEVFLNELIEKYRKISPLGMYGMILGRIIRKFLVKIVNPFWTKIGRTAGYFPGRFFMRFSKNL